MTIGARACLLGLACALAGCAEIGPRDPDPVADGGGSAGSIAPPDASPQQPLSDASADDESTVPQPDAAPAAPEPEPDPEPEPEPVPATVTASCLFLRQGPGTDTPKVPCTAAGPECNADNDVCMPMGDIFEVNGGPSSGAGCTEWYPGTYKTYEGHACGDYLEFPSGARLISPKSPTRYPSAMDGPQG